MPCPHNEITIVQRSQRQSAVAAAAYQSGEKLFCEYDQQVKHYPEKRGIVHNEILLPADAGRSGASLTVPSTSLTRAVGRGIIYIDKNLLLDCRKEDILKQSSKKISTGTAALYCRLSRDDNMDSESNSIQNHDVMYRGWITPKNITS